MARARAALIVGLEMLRLLGPDGRLDPTHDTIAERAHADPRTVRRVLKQLAEVGMLRWVRRLVRDGETVRQTSNSYALIPASNAAQTGLELAGGHHARQTRQTSFEKDAQERQTVPAGLPYQDQAADRRSLAGALRALEARLARAWGERGRTKFHQA